MMPEGRALAKVLHMFDAYTDVTFVRRRQRGLKQSARQVRRVIVDIFPLVYHGLTMGPQTTSSLRDFASVPDDKLHNTAIKWIVRSICEEETRFNPDRGHRSRGFWRLLHPHG